MQTLTTRQARVLEEVRELHEKTGKPVPEFQFKGGLLVQLERKGAVERVGEQVSELGGFPVTWGLFVPKTKNGS